MLTVWGFGDRIEGMAEKTKLMAGAGSAGASRKEKREAKTVVKVVEKKRKLEQVKIPSYTLGEELVNSISHGVGAGLAIAALVLCVVKATTPAAIVGASLYGSFMIILYVISCIYHALSPRLLGKKVMRILDHINVMLMVAGTYMPVCLSMFQGALGWILFAVVWAITVPAIVLNAINVDKYQYVSVACNLILGWGVLFLLPALLEHAPLAGILAFLVGGGAVYSIGSILYVRGAEKKWRHSIFHFFVLAASVLHFFFIYLYCL